MARALFYRTAFGQFTRNFILGIFFFYLLCFPADAMLPNLSNSKSTSNHHYVRQRLPKNKYLANQNRREKIRAQSKGEPGENLGLSRTRSISSGSSSRVNVRRTIRTRLSDKRLRLKQQKISALSGKNTDFESSGDHYHGRFDFSNSGRLPLPSLETQMFKNPLGLETFGGISQSEAETVEGSLKKLKENLELETNNNKPQTEYLKKKKHNKEVLLKKIHGDKKLAINNLVEDSFLALKTVFVYEYNYEYEKVQKIKQFYEKHKNILNPSPPPSPKTKELKEFLEDIQFDSSYQSFKNTQNLETTQKEKNRQEFKILAKEFISDQFFNEHLNPATIEVKGKIPIPILTPAGPVVGELALSTTTGENSEQKIKGGALTPFFNLTGEKSLKKTSSLSCHDMCNILDQVDDSPVKFNKARLFRAKLFSLQEALAIIPKESFPDDFKIANFNSWLFIQNQRLKPYSMLNDSSFENNDYVKIIINENYDANKIYGENQIENKSQIRRTCSAPECIASLTLNSSNLRWNTWKRPDHIHGQIKFKELNFFYFSMALFGIFFGLTLFIWVLFIDFKKRGFFYDMVHKIWEGENRF